MPEKSTYLSNLISPDILELYELAYNEKISETFLSYMNRILHLDELSTEYEKRETLNSALLEEIRFATEIPEVIKRLDEIVVKYDKNNNLFDEKEMVC